MSRIHITIDGVGMSVDDGLPLLVHAREQGIEIPTLCHDDRLTPYATCCLCVVEIENTKGFTPACTRFPEEGMVIRTDSEGITRARRRALRLLFSDHYANCIPPCKVKKPPTKFISRRGDFSRGQSALPLCVKEVSPAQAGVNGMQLFDAPSPDCRICQCGKMGTCEIRRLAIKYQVLADEHLGEYHAYEFRRLSPLLGLDMNKCIRCTKCIRACSEIQGVGILGFIHRGFDTDLCYMADLEDKQAQCMDCALSGARCVEVCPTGALQILDKNAAAASASPGGQG